MVLEYLAANGMRSKEEKSAADVRENHPEPGVRDVVDDPSAKDAAQQGCRFDGSNKRRCLCPCETGPQKQCTQCKALGDFVNAHGENE